MLKIVHIECYGYNGPVTPRHVPQAILLNLFIRVRKQKYTTLFTRCN